MKDDAASALIDELVEALIEARETFGDSWHHADYEESRRRVLRLLPAAQALANGLPYGVDATDLEPDQSGWEFATTYDAALRLQGAVQNMARVKEALSQQAPQLSADSFHDWVWEAAASLWRDGHHRSAIHAAAAQIETRLQAKLGREDVSGVALIREAFTLNEPTASKPRLRFAWLNAGEAHKSRHEGALSLGVGIFQLVRNSAAHNPTKLSESVALEHLALLSYLARLIEVASVVGAVPQNAQGDEDRPFG